MSNGHAHTHHADHPTDGGGDHNDDHTNGDFAELLDLDAAVLHEYWSAALTWVQNAAAGSTVTRILDLGAGTGTGAIGLAQRFPSAEVVAVDVSTDGLRRLRAKAAELGLTARLHTVAADLDAGWPDFGALDLTWASMSLHHLTNPDQGLRDTLAATRPGGLIAVAEFPHPLLLLPDVLGVGRPGFEPRVVTALNHAHAEAMPTLGTAWAPRLTDAGWHVVADHEFTIDLDPPADPGAPRYAWGWFERLSRNFTVGLDPDDRTTLAALLDEDGAHSLLHRTDLHFRGVRTVTIARAE